MFWTDQEITEHNFNDVLIKVSLELVPRLDHDFVSRLQLLDMILENDLYWVSCSDTTQCPFAILHVVNKATCEYFSLLGSCPHSSPVLFGNLLFFNAHIIFDLESRSVVFLSEFHDASVSE
jgi:hypothetical protein